MGKWVTPCKDNKGSIPIIFLSTILVSKYILRKTSKYKGQENLCVGPHLKNLVSHPCKNLKHSLTVR